MFHRILVCLDGTPFSEKILGYAASEARRYSSKIILFHVCTKDIESIPVPITGQFTYVPIEAILGSYEEACTNTKSQLEMLARNLMDDGFNVEVVVVEGIRSDLADIIIGYAKENNIDLIAMATHGRKGIKRLFWGSVADSITGKSSIPVLVVRPDHIVSSREREEWREEDIESDPETLIGVSM